MKITKYIEKETMVCEFWFTIEGNNSLSGSEKLDETNWLKPNIKIIIEATKITRMNSETNINTWLRKPRRFITGLKIIAIARIIERNIFRAIQIIHTPRKISKKWKFFLFRMLFIKGWMSTIDCISEPRAFTYSRMPGDTLIIPTRTVKIIRASGTKEKIKPKEQAEALSKRLLLPKLVQVR